jgi:hypothetical protein
MALGALLERRKELERAMVPGWEGEGGRFGRVWGREIGKWEVQLPGWGPI